MLNGVAPRPTGDLECREERGLRGVAAVNIAQGTRRVPRPTSQSAAR